MFKGDAGALVYNIGNFICGGNMIIGAMLLFALVVTYYILINIINMDTQPQNKIYLKTCCVADTILLLLNTFGFYYIFAFLHQMLYTDAFAKVIVNGAGATILTGLMTLVVFFVAQHKNETNFETVNNPFKLVGKIGRLVYFSTMISLIIMHAIWMVMLGLVISSQQVSFFSISCLVLAFLFGGIISIIDMFASSKRLRDVQWHQWYLLLLPIPVVTLLARLPLLFIKGK